MRSWLIVFVGNLNNCICSDRLSGSRNTPVVTGVKVACVSGALSGLQQAFTSGTSQLGTRYTDLVVSAYLLQEGSEFEGSIKTRLQHSKDLNAANFEECSNGHLRIADTHEMRMSCPQFVCISNYQGFRRQIRNKRTDLLLTAFFFIEKPQTP